jgi:hypothetical protein
MDGHLRDHLAYYYDQAGFALSPAAAEERVGQALRVARLALLEAGRKGDAAVLELASELIEDPSPAPRVAFVLPELPEPLHATVSTRSNRIGHISIHGAIPATLETAKAAFPGAAWDAQPQRAPGYLCFGGTWRGIGMSVFVDDRSATKTRKSRRAA